LYVGLVANVHTYGSSSDSSAARLPTVYGEPPEPLMSHEPTAFFDGSRTTSATDTPVAASDSLALRILIVPLTSQPLSVPLSLVTVTV